MSNLPPVSHAIDAEGVGWITFDDPAARANVFNLVALGALRAAVAELARHPVRAVVLCSAKERIFVAGADLKWLAALPDAAAAGELAREGQAVFGLLAGLPVPVVCAIHGACAGGGFELALACTWRIATEARETVIGLPEVGLGLVPGWGGSARLPRLIGPEAAVEFILRSALVPAGEALAAGLVDEVVPAGELKPRARAAALRLAAAGAPARRAWPAAPAGFFARQRALAAARRPGQPAPPALLDAVERGAARPLSAALVVEAECFAAVAAGAVAKNLIHVFLLKEAGRKTTVAAWFPPAPAGAADREKAPAPALRTIGIVGAGVMGSGIAHWCAARGYGVILCDSNREAIERGVGVIRNLFGESVRRGQLKADVAHRMTGGIGITTSLEDFEICDLVIEAIVEDVGAKQQLFAELEKKVGPHCLLATNTSALPLEELGAGLADPGRLLGLHFFNPVARMPLVELVLGTRTERATAERALAFLQVLGKTPVICRSSPGFLITRVLFFYLNAACRLREQGVPAESIDGAMRDWGWPMGPLRLMDEVGLDVTDFIFDEMQRYFPGRFAASALCRRMVAAGLPGRKNGSGSGFYVYAEEGERLNAAAPAPGAAPAEPAADASSIQDQLTRILVEETGRALAEGVVKTPDEADLALLLGAGFPAIRGGLMRYARSVGLYAG